MADKLKPIETQYKGYRFRSRLEARWAVFFDTLKVQYEYEKEGFDLGKHGWYLPDFWIPDWQAWVEIKPDLDFNSPEDEGKTAKVMALVQQSRKDCLLILGTPWPQEFHLWHFCVRANNLEFEMYREISQCRHCEGLCLHSDTPELWKWHFLGTHTCVDNSTPPLSVNTGYAPRVMSAYESARSARFEYGENPT